MSSIVVPTLNSIVLDNRRPAQSMAASFIAFERQVRIRIRTLSDLLELRFAEFAGVPFQSPASLQQWEDLWETEAEPQRPRS